MLVMRFLVMSLTHISIVLKLNNKDKFNVERDRKLQLGKKDTGLCMEIYLWNINGKIFMEIYLLAKTF